MSLYRYSGPETVYPFLHQPDGSVAPMTLVEGDCVALREAPADGRFTHLDALPDGVVLKLPDNHPDVIRAANEEASRVEHLLEGVADEIQLEGAAVAQEVAKVTRRKKRQAPEAPVTEPPAPPANGSEAAPTGDTVTE